MKIFKYLDVVYKVNLSENFDKEGHIVWPDKKDKWKVTMTALSARKAEELFEAEELIEELIEAQRDAIADVMIEEGAAVDCGTGTRARGLFAVDELGNLARRNLGARRAISAPVSLAPPWPSELGEHSLRGDGVELAAEVEDGRADLDPAGFQRCV